uniref:Uncharacterized protein n=1 Tax=Anguilla anguilla TaxID=7936 RepID=A0A0E9X566_ANGAN
MTQAIFICCFFFSLVGDSGILLAGPIVLWHFDFRQHFVPPQTLLQHYVIHFTLRITMGICL